MGGDEECGIREVGENTTIPAALFFFARISKRSRSELEIGSVLQQFRAFAHLHAQSPVTLVRLSDRADPDWIVVVWRRLNEWDFAMNGVQISHPSYLRPHSVHSKWGMSTAC